MAVFSDNATALAFLAKAGKPCLGVLNAVAQSVLAWDDHAIQIVSLLVAGVGPGPSALS